MNTQETIKQAEQEFIQELNKVPALFRGPVKTMGTKLFLIMELMAREIEALKK